MGRARKEGKKLVASQPSGELPSSDDREPLLVTFSFCFYFRECSGKYGEKRYVS